jgi:hypothetical protein
MAATESTVPSGRRFTATLTSPKCSQRAPFADKREEPERSLRPYRRQNLMVLPALQSGSSNMLRRAAARHKCECDTRS